MCGITGICWFNDQGRAFLKNIDKAVDSLVHRGPDNKGVYIKNNVGLGQTRLSIIDTSDAATQPFTDSFGRYTIVLNGEFYNYQQYRKALIDEGVQFRSSSDTEVLLQLFITEGIACLNKINGDFSFAVYDSLEKELFLARDRMGVKPLFCYQDEEKFIFGSEMKSLLAFGIPKELDMDSVNEYFQLNYIPSPNSIFKNVKKLIPGEYLRIKYNQVTSEKYYSIPYLKNKYQDISYENAQIQLIKLLDSAVERRLVSDVPLGAFLSGGIDSSIIVALASHHLKQLNTFSVGFKDEPFFDETNYAEQVARKYNTNHTVFKLSNDDIFSVLHDVLDYTDEPFADSSALAVYILSKKTRQKVTVALSGDGADEMFSGYNKHQAHFMAMYPGMAERLICTVSPLLKFFPQSRNGKFSNLIRQLNRFSDGMKLTEKNRYLRWCSLASEKQVRRLLLQCGSENELLMRKQYITEYINDPVAMYDILYSDMHLVLQGDMLVKADMMSMGNGLEVRVPFLDHTVVDFVFSLPDEYKINKTMRKRILQDTFRDLLPQELYNRPKHGFEVPLLKWFRSDLKGMIQDDLLSDDFIQQQGFFNRETISTLKKQLYSSSPGDVHARIWALIVFQYWWKKYFV